jgi:hypothetical protein
MLKLPPFLSGLKYHQWDLDRLCSERPLDWSEYHHMNQFHGNASILMRYAGLPPENPLPFCIEHAIPYDLDEAYEYDLSSGLKTFLAVNERSANLYRKAGVPKVHPIGFSHLYALDLYHEIHANEPHPERRGTIVFPDKSTLLMETDFDREKFATILANLPDEFQPVVVCIYWKDYVRGTHIPFCDAGLPLVTCGHLLDGDFLLRFHDLCRNFKYSCANDIAGSFTLSILSGCQFFFLNAGSMSQLKYGKKTTYKNDPSLSKPIKRSCIEAAPFPPEGGDLQQEMAQSNAGCAFKKSKETIRELYDQAKVRQKRTEPLFRFDFDDEPDKSMLFSHLPVGIDTDGWIREYASLHLIVPDNTRAIRFEVYFPYNDSIKKQQIIITCNKKKLKTVSLRSGNHKIITSIMKL